MKKLALVLTTPNRTILELKLEAVKDISGSTISPNRTILELKRINTM